mmetsp:Transcript_5548/g.10115  ORF Transcript_5548/g.10115 Transcript_5548/m.10115 type:complete len:201 (+) Transcript_5548:135-737(+)|eukprot:CAMPEP_0201614358 /NCGR_PEP_ID=MMETSP0492-20130828/28515_1 /ASSEMBLY_ACC=CAM_ASM_000837 /TAXON_ID=420259 /ORGANISM="Thalassiosira gravida, Strain GMp14c1" /LENGTH=200 /DNA_ID=CAMNT_0048081601 /DNA_START=121 /DNA_END=723 /DNA_ORIENTATION=-
MIYSISNQHHRCSLNAYPVVRALGVAAMFSASVSSFSIQQSGLQPRSHLRLPSRVCPQQKNPGSIMAIFSSEKDMGGEKDSNISNEQKQEFDIDEMNTIAELNDLSRSIGGPVIDEKSSIESARNRLWDFVEEEAEDDIDNMCMGQISGLMFELSGENLEDDITLEEARDKVWELVNRLSQVEVESESKACSGCPSCAGK